VCLDRYRLVDAETFTPAPPLRAFFCRVVTGTLSWLFPLTTPVPFGVWDKYQRSPIEKALRVVYIRRDG
jgi:hypothetical protein